jgi:hypothetical protein
MPLPIHSDLGASWALVTSFAIAPLAGAFSIAKTMPHACRGFLIKRLSHHDITGP